MQEGYGKLIVYSNNGYFENVLDTIQRTVKKNDAKFKKEEKRTENFIDHDGYTRDEYLGDLGYEHYQTEQILYKGFFVSVFMFMESKLIELCDHLQKEHNQIFSVHDLGRGSVKNAIKYIKKVLNIDFPKNNVVATDFETAMYLRNKIVHTDGKISDVSEQREFEKKYKDYKEKIALRNGEIEFKEAYLKDLIALNEKICDEISDNWLEKDDWHSK